MGEWKKILAAVEIRLDEQKWTERARRRVNICLAWHGKKGTPTVCGPQTLQFKQGLESRSANFAECSMKF